MKANVANLFEMTIILISNRITDYHIYNSGHKSSRAIPIQQSYLINEQKFPNIKDGAGAPATPLLFSFKIAIVQLYCSYQA